MNTTPATPAPSAERSRSRSSRAAPLVVGWTSATRTDDQGVFTAPGTQVSTTPCGPRPRTTPPPPAARPLSVVLGLLGVGAAAVSLLGPLGTGALEYHVSSGARDQVRGGDLAALVLVAPVCLAAAWLVHRGRAAAEALALAPASYGLYMWSQLAMSGDVARYPGTSERWFPLFWALVTLACAGIVLAGRRLVQAPEPCPRRRLELVTGWYFLVVAAFLTVGLHLPGLVDAWRDQPTSAEYLADPGIFWIVKLMDLAVVVPVVVAVGAGLLTGYGWARRLLAPVTGWCALLASSVAGMGVTMVLADSPGASVPLAVGFTAAAAAALALAVTAYRPLLGSQDTGTR